MSYKDEQDLLFQEMEDRQRLAEKVERERVWKYEWVSLGYPEAGFEAWFKLVQDLVKLDPQYTSIVDYMESFFENRKVAKKK
jgi:hypothetical protein